MAENFSVNLHFDAAAAVIEAVLERAVYCIRSRTAGGTGRRCGGGGTDGGVPAGLARTLALVWNSMLLITGVTATELRNVLRLAGNRRRIPQGVARGLVRRPAALANGLSRDCPLSDDATGLYAELQRLFEVAFKSALTRGRSRRGSLETLKRPGRRARRNARRGLR